MNNYTFIPYYHPSFPEAEMLERSREFYQWMNKRRTVRDFSDKPVPKEIIENIILTAGTAPSGAHRQPWVFCVVSNKELKSKLRTLAEEEEYKTYNERMSDEWRNALEPLGTDWHKPFIDIAPWIIVVFKKPYDTNKQEKVNNYYVSESVGLACGFLLAAIHHAGLVALTHTPSPMNFLAKALNRPENERPFLLIPVGYPAEEVKVPDLIRKQLKEIAFFYE
ncbi:MAG: nitroreductase family protein [Bacteroidota bacterium]